MGLVPGHSAEGRVVGSVSQPPVFLSQVEMGFLRSLCYLFFVWWEKEEEGKIRV